MRKAILCLIVAVAVAGCSNGRAGFDYRQNVTPITGEFLPVDEADGLIGRVHHIVCMDTLLIFYDHYERMTLSVYDLKNKRLAGRHVSVGNGPGEVIPPLDILAFPQKNRLYVYQRNASIVNTFGVPDFRMLSSMTFTSSTPWRPFRIAKSKDYYIGQTIYDKGCYGIYNMEGELLQTGGTYPFSGENIERSAAFVLYQSDFCANPEGNTFASGCCFSDRIAFYEIGENEVTLLKEYASRDIRATYPGQMVIDDDCMIGYVAAFGTASYCYMLFSGKTYAQNNKRTTWGNYIIVFDWLGNYVKTLETDREILQFCVDETNGMIYATALDDDEEYGIIQFKL
jgi:hypothetical protein